MVDDKIHRRNQRRLVQFSPLLTVSKRNNKMRLILIMTLIMFAFYFVILVLNQISEMKKSNQCRKRFKKMMNEK